MMKSRDQFTRFKRRSRHATQPLLKPLVLFCFAVALVSPSGAQAVKHGQLAVTTTASDADNCILKSNEAVCFGSVGPQRPARVNGFKSAYAISSFLSSQDGQNCVLDLDGVWCWGSLSVPVPASLKFKNPRRIAAGNSFTCVIDDEGLKCWGDSRHYSLPGDLTTASEVSLSSGTGCVIQNKSVRCFGSDVSTVMTPRGLTNASAIAVSDYESACALNDGSLVCWGDRASVALPDLKNPRELSTSQSEYCALDDDGVTCWSENATSRPLNQKLSHPRGLSGGLSSGCVIDDDDVHCWGRAQTRFPIELKSPHSFTTFSQGTCALDDGGIRCWGDSDIYPISLPKFNLRSIYKLNAFESYQGNRFCAQSSEGVECFVLPGRYDSGHEARLFIPADQHPGLTAGGSFGACVVSDAGLKCTINERLKNVFNPPPWSSKITELTGGYYSLCANGAGGIECYEPEGFDHYLTAVPTFSKPHDLSIAGEVACVIDEGAVKCWGDVDHQKDRPPSSLKHPRFLVGGGNGTDFSNFCALDDSGLVCWGGNEKVTLNPPKISDVSALSISSSNACVETMAGPFCWGDDYSGAATIPTNWWQ
jgi:hypothetical protein